MRPAGTLLLALARLLFDDSVLSHVVYPTIADLQEEVREAGTDRRRRLLARWRGYRAFWVLVIASPIAFRSWPMTPQTDGRALLNVSALIVAALVVVAVLTTSGAMAEFGSPESYKLNPEWLPEALLVRLGEAHVLAFMAGPLVLGALFAISRLRGRVRFTVRPAEAMLLVLLSATAVVTTGAAVLVNAFTGIARTGGGGISLVHEAWVTALDALMYASAVVAACLLVVAALTTWRAARGSDTAPTQPPRMTARLAVALAAVVSLTLVAVELLVRIYNGTLDLMVSMFEAPRSAAALGSIAETSALVAHNMGLLFAGGAVLTGFLVTASAVTWRVSRSRTPHAILTWASRAALAIVIVGALWHAGVARATLDAYRGLPQVKARYPVVDRM